VARARGQRARHAQAAGGGQVRPEQTAPGGHPATPGLTQGAARPHAYPLACMPFAMTAIAT